VCNLDALNLAFNKVMHTMTNSFNVPISSLQFLKKKHSSFISKYLMFYYTTVSVINYISIECT